MNFKNYFEELKRRNVFKAALAYIVVAWIIIQVASIVFPAFKASPEILRSIIIILVIGFPAWLVFAWVYEMTPDGLKKTKAVDRKKSITSETGSRFNKLILGALGVAIILLAANLYSSFTRAEPSEAGNIKSLVTENPADKSKEEKSVAVLAFADMSPQKDQEYFSDGISEEILNYLAKISELTVISRTSSFSFKGKNTDIREIGEKLNANYVLEGSVRKADSTLRITAQLIHVEDGAHLWSETYDREMNDIFKIQDDIAQAVTKNLEASLLGEKLETVDPEAYKKYFQAKFLRNQYTKESLDNADRLINESIQIDDKYAPAWLLLARIKENRGAMGLIDREQAAAICNDAIEKAISIEPDYAEAYALRGRIAHRKLNFRKAEENFKMALEIAPKNSEVLNMVSELSTLKIEERIKIVQHSIKLDPLNYMNYYGLSYLYSFNGEFEKALEALNYYMIYFPNSLGDHGTKAEILALLGREEEALEELDKEEGEFYFDYAKAIISTIFYEGKEAREAVNVFKQKYKKQFPYLVAQMYASINNKDEVFKWLNKAYEVKSPNIWIFPDDNYLKPFKNDPRWKEFVDKTGFPGKSSLEIDLD